MRRIAPVVPRPLVTDGLLFGEQGISMRVVPADSPVLNVRPPGLFHCVLPQARVHMPAASNVEKVPIGVEEPVYGGGARALCRAHAGFLSRASFSCAASRSHVAIDMARALAAAATFSDSQKGQRSG